MCFIRAEHIIRADNYKLADCCDSEDRGCLGLYTLQKCEHTVAKLWLKKSRKTNFKVDNVIWLTNDVINIKMIREGKKVFHP